MRTPAALALLTALALAGCGGGGATSGSTIPNGGGGNNTGSPQSAQQQSENSINAQNALGEPMKSIDDFNSDFSGATAVSKNRAGTQSVRTLAVANGTCVNGYEFFAPDKNSDANSTEAIYFYDSACTQPANDTVRLYTVNGTSETVTRTETTYAIGNATAIATRTATVNVLNGTYDSNGFPIASDGFARSAVSTLSLATLKTISSGDEIVVAPSSSGTTSFCSDSAGFNETGIAKLSETFGWQGGVTTGTRVDNGAGSVTWTSTHAGSTFKGPIGSLSLGNATQNTACPISTPQFTLVGGTQGNAYTIPVTATYTNGELTNLSVTNATLASGYTLNVTTNTSVAPTNSAFITGATTNGSTQIATFSADTFGDGILTITASGVQYVINDWHVVK